MSLFSKQREPKVIEFGDAQTKAIFGDTVKLQKQEAKVVRCQESDVLMVNLDLDDLQKGDLHFLKKLGLTISNPETDEPVALGVEISKKRTAAEVVHDYLTSSDDDEEDEDEDDDDDDDSWLFGGTTGGFLGGGSLGSSWGSMGGGGFGGFGGGSFSGGGVSRGF